MVISENYTLNFLENDITNVKAIASRNVFLIITIKFI